MSNPIIGAFEILGIRDAGNLEKERLLLRAIEPVSLEYYIVVNVKTNGGGKLTILNDKVFWFPVVSVSAGEFVRLYTKSGLHEKKEGKYGEIPTIYYDFYWGSNAPIWGSVTSNAVTVFKVNNWNTAYQL